VRKLVFKLILHDNRDTYKSNFTVQTIEEIPLVMVTYSTMTP